MSWLVVPFVVAVPSFAQGLPAPGVSPAQVRFSDLRVQSQPGSVSYPPLAQIAGVQGVVIVEITVNPFGHVAACKAVDGPAALRHGAEQIPMQWTFEPFKKEGKAIWVRCEAMIPFQIKELASDAEPLETLPTVLELEIRDKSYLSVPVDEGHLRVKVMEHLRPYGLTWIEPSTMDPAHAFHLKLSIQAFKSYGDVCLQSVYARFSKWSDKNLEKNEPGKPLRVSQAFHVMGQRSVGGFQDRLLDNVRRSLNHLVLPAWSGPVTPKVIAENVTATTSATTKVGGRIVDFDFSQIKIKRQPPAPSYPAEARAEHVQGTVVVEITIDSTGKPAYVEALEGPSLLLVSAIRYALGWEFEPATLNGVPMQARFKLTMPYRLR